MRYRVISEVRVKGWPHEHVYHNLVIPVDASIEVARDSASPGTAMITWDDCEYSCDWSPFAGSVHPDEG